MLANTRCIGPVRSARQRWRKTGPCTVAAGLNNAVCDIRSTADKHGSDDNRRANDRGDCEAGVGGGSHDSVTYAGAARERATVVEKALAAPAEVRGAAGAGHVAATMVTLNAGSAGWAGLGVEGGPQAEEGAVGFVGLARRAHMLDRALTGTGGGGIRDETLALHAGAGLAPVARHNSILHGVHGEPSQKLPAHVAGAPAGVRTGVEAVTGAKVQHLAECALGDDGGDVGIGGEDAAAAIHAEQAGVVSRVDGAGPVLVDARGAVAVGAGGAAAQEVGRDVLAADVAEDVRLGRGGVRLGGGALGRVGGVGARGGRAGGARGAAHLRDGDLWRAHGAACSRRRSGRRRAAAFTLAVSDVLGARSTQCDAQWTRCRGVGARSRAPRRRTRVARALAPAVSIVTGAARRQSPRRTWRRQRRL